jgi:hypothetical protein
MLRTLGRAALTLAVVTALGAATEVSSEAAPAAASSSVRPNDNPYFPKWKVTHVGKAYRTYGKWKNCVVFSKESTPHTVTCALSRTTSTTVSGSLTVSVKAMSGAVGYQVQKSYSVTGSETYTADKKKSGRIQWREAYNTNKVTEKKYMCPLHGTCTYTNPVGTAYAYTHKYIGPNFRIVYDK